MADTEKAAEEMRFDHLLYQLLERHDGVFLGDYHPGPSLLQSLTLLMPALKARGVGTLSIELPQKMIDSMLQAASTDQWIKTHITSPDPLALASAGMAPGDAFTGGEKAARASCELCRATHRLGIQVLGHEKIMVSGTAHSWAEKEREINQRNAQSCSYIKQHKKGKVLVVGGAAHSGDFTPEDSIDWGWQLPDDDPGKIRNRRVYTIVKNHYSGLDKRLGYPSIDYNWVDPKGPIGQTSETDGRFNDYEVVLPPDLREFIKGSHMRNWPPEKGIPTLEETTVPQSALLPKIPSRKSPPQK